MALTDRLSQTWDLESFFPGGSSSPDFRAHLDRVETETQALARAVESLGDPSGPAEIDRWCDVLTEFQAIYDKLVQGWAFAGCLTSQDVKDREAKLLNARVLQMGAAIEAITTQLDDRILRVSDDLWEKLLADPRIEPVAFPLRERRTRAKRLMAPAMELLATDLAVDGYHSWSAHYDTIVGRMTIPFEVNGKVEELSVGQAFNKFAEPDRAMRTTLHEKWEAAWEKEAELIAATLNHIGGFRLSLYRHRGWDSILSEPLEINRMTEATLNAMWEAASVGKTKLARYFQRKANLIGAETLNWYDLRAPLYTETPKVSYEDAAVFIEEQFRRFSPRMADFARDAFRNRWLEVEDRPGKAPGGYCTDFPLHGQSRIFMTYSGDADGVRTLAHELGHAYHTDVMKDLPSLSRNYAMNVAETASTFAEILINAAAIANAKTKQERLALLDSKISDSLGYLMNIHARFLFETRFYAERKKGHLSLERLNDLMVAAQKEAYADSLGAYHPHFWASKGHFYMSGVPFYNFPYTFGYLFSAGVYARAMEEGPRFEQRYVDLLRDTGRCTVEDLAARHLGVDLTKPAFWMSGVQLAIDGVDEFLRLTAE